MIDKPASRIDGIGFSYGNRPIRTVRIWAQFIYPAAPRASGPVAAPDLFPDQLPHLVPLQAIADEIDHPSLGVGRYNFRE
jgi:hypothetical protein